MASTFFNQYKKWFVRGGIALVALILLFSSVYIISPNQRGVLTTLGKMSPTEIQPGMYVKAPFITSVRKVSIRPFEVTVKIPVTDQGAITKDNQIVGADIKLYYTYKTGQIAKMVSEIGESNVNDRMIAYLNESFKTTVGKYTIFEFALNQQTIREATEKYLTDRVTNFPVSVASVAVTNYNWSPEFDKQIQATMNAAQEVRKKEQELLTKKIEAQKEVVQQEADTAIQKLKADGEKYKQIATAEGKKQATLLEAEAKVKEGEAIKKYNDLIRSTLDVEIKFRELEISKIRAEKWDGREIADNKIMPFPINGLGK